MRSSAFLKQKSLVVFVAFLAVQTSVWAASISSPSSPSRPSTGNQDSLLQQARLQKLWKERQWQLLLHYEKRLMGGERSEAAADFFVSPQGATQPQAELEANLVSFFQTDDPELDQELDGQKLKSATVPGQVRQHPQCRFPARYAWLKSKLSFASAGLMDRPCQRYQNWRQSLRPDSVSLIFASYYMSNPASLFGHTLLKLNRPNHEGLEILDYGVNYSANVTTKNPFLYAFFGVTGGFNGSFSNFPYYMKVQEYSNFEARDLWEYELDLKPEVIDRLMAHLWELGHTSFDYFFFKRNCSFYVLTLLEASEPSLRLTNGKSLWVIPSDTVRKIADHPGLVKKVSYRPSQINRLAQKRDAMNSVQAQAFHYFVGRVHETNKAEKPPAQNKSWTQNPLYLALTDKEKPLVLDSLIDYMHFQKVENNNHLSGAQSQLLNEALLERSTLGPSPVLAERQDSDPPHQAHDSFRASVSGGLTQAWGPFTEIGLHPAFHDFMAKDLGLPPLSQIELMNMRLRYYPEESRFRLHQLRIVDVASLTPYDSLFPHASWKANLGVDTIRDIGEGAAGGDHIDCTACSRVAFNVGYGAAWSPFPKRYGMLYGFLEWEAAIASAYRRGYRLAPGASMGLVYDVSRDMRLHVMGAAYQPLLGDRAFSYKGLLQARYTVLSYLDARLELAEYRRDREVLGTFNFFF